MAYAIFKTGGKQYRVSAGDVIDVEKLEAEEGAELSFDTVLCTGDGDNASFGAPFLSGATVKATVKGQVRAKKVIAFKYKRRKGYHKTKGHRRQLTRLEITAI